MDLFLMFGIFLLAFGTLARMMGTNARRIINLAFAAFFLAGLASLGWCDEAAAVAAMAPPAATGFAKLLPLLAMLGMTVLKTVGAGAIFKGILGLKVGGDEIIHRVPEWFRPFTTTTLCFLVFIPYVIWGGAYDGAGGDVKLQADLVGVLGSGTSANMIHDAFTTWFPPKGK